ncbi:hypothetical protein FEE95_10020 [Maribacter algarum]|uniref:Pycsar effector protein domain-containing protein n=1 Tax=Maribacter algarum (ex Zhang et al. 2020) TaxID=2578118 RepID=A0A5S3PV59_9FLAO|nr:hypothetical protein [Maribacter algarum]TMM56828.1 hypothetical protein FEE95_10020 [Maribacter algarum]
MNNENQHLNDKDPDELISKAENNSGKDLYDTKKEPRKSMGVYLKNQNRLIMSSIAIADKKAAILIRINTAIISALIVFESYFEGNSSFNNQIIPILIIGLSISLIFAILAAKPFSFIMYKVFNKIIKKKYPNLEENNFMIFEVPEFEKYELSMQKVLKSQNLQIGNLTRFNYFMSKSISRNYLQLEIAYTAFLITFLIVTIFYISSNYF